MFKRRTLTSALMAATLLVATSAFAQFAERTIKFTNGVNEDHPVGLGVKRMQEVLNAKTGGKIKINAFWGGSAGGDLPATKALRAGTFPSCSPTKKKPMPCWMARLAPTSTRSSKTPAW